MSKTHHVAFTGSQNGMVTVQNIALTDWLRRKSPTHFHHGICVGSDEQAHKIVRNMLWRCTIIGHPCFLKSKQSKVECDLLRVVKAPIARNHDIVDESDELAATPATNYEVLRSGTWATVRYALKQSKPVTIFYPDGRVGHQLP